MSSRSSNNRPLERLPVGRIAGHRGPRGELTVRVFGGDAAPWTALRRVWIEGKDGGRRYEVEGSRAYRDRLVLKLKGVDDANAAAALRGREVLAVDRDAPALPANEYYVAHLVGCRVLDETDHELGRVIEVLRTGGTDLLRVVPERAAASGDEDEGDRDRKELLIPMAKEFLLEIDEAEGRIRVRLPEGLTELNRVKS